MRVAVLTTDNREHHRRYDLPEPYFGPAIEAVLQGLATLGDLEVHVISCTQRPMRAPEKIFANTHFHLLHVPKIGWLRTAYQGCVRAIRRKMRQLQPDVVHGEGTERECGLGAVFSGFPNVVTLHGNMIELSRVLRAKPASYYWCAGILERVTLPRTGGVFCNSAYTETLVKRYARKTWRVPNALRREFFDVPLPTETLSGIPKILNVGAVSPRKRQVEILDQAEQLHRRGKLFELQFIGAADPQDSYAAAFLRKIKDAERAGFARYAGDLELTELLAAFDSASALIHAPFEEAFGLVVAEALARNLKFFGNRLGGIPDIADGVDGAELFPLGSDAMTDAIGTWLATGCPRPQTAASEMRRRYHPEVIARQHVRIYQELLQHAE